MRRYLTALACAASLAALAGCGASQDEQAGDTVDAYLNASKSGDRTGVCDLLSDDFKAQLQLTADCPGKLPKELASQLAGSSFTVVDIRVRGDQGAADIDVSQGGEPGQRVRLVLVNEDGDWRIAGQQ